MFGLSLRLWLMIDFVGWAFRAFLGVWVVGVGAVYVTNLGLELLVCGLVVCGL